MKTAFFIEAISSPSTANLQICKKLMVHLFKEKIFPLPFASNLKEYQEVLSSLAPHHAEIGIFVINTYFADGLIKELSSLLPVAIPILSLRREICCSPFNLPKHTIIEWVYGSKNIDIVVEKSYKLIIEYLNTEQLTPIENFAIDQRIQIMRLKTE